MVINKIDDPVWFGKSLQVVDSPVYVLRAMVMHAGGGEQGHFTACCRSEEGGWGLFNDAMRPRALSEAEVFPHGVSDIHRNVRTFFYERTYAVAPLGSAGPSLGSSGFPWFPGTSSSLHPSLEKYTKQAYQKTFIWNGKTVNSCAAI